MSLANIIALGVVALTIVFGVFAIRSESGKLQGASIALATANVVVAAWAITAALSSMIASGPNVFVAISSALLAACIAGMTAYKTEDAKSRHLFWHGPGE